MPIPAGFDPGQRLEHEPELLDWIRDHTGISLHDHQLGLFREGIVRACGEFACATPAEFLERLRSTASRSPEREFLISHITVGESYFFRIPEQIDFLRRHWLPQIIEKKRAQGNLSLRIWSAGCSGGEELYTMALLLHEMLPDIREWSVHLAGTDINANALRKAREGLYSQWSLRTLSAEEIALYFQQQDNGYQLRPAIRNMAQFTPLNLACDPYPSLEQGICAMDLILCRNVFIYFTSQAIERIMAGFAGTLADEGCLILAPADLVSQHYKGLRLLSQANVFYFVRGEDEAAVVQAPIEPFEMPAAVASDFRPVAESTLEPVVTQAVDSDFDRIAELLAAHQWHPALDAANDLAGRFPDDAQAHYWQACCLSSLGETAAAQESCNRGLEADPMSAGLYHLRATLLLDQGDHGEAEAGFRRALYLDWERPDTHFQLAMLKERNHDGAAVLKHLNDALKSALGKPADAPLDALSGMTFARMVEILQDEISARRRNPSQ